jgi:hypothetical protein
VIVELEGDGPARARQAVLVATLCAVALAVALVPDVSRSLGTLALAPDEGDVQLFALPERLANDPQPANQTLVVRVRGTVGVGADAEGAVTLSWSERGYFYRLSSGTLGIAELARVAGRLR